MTKKLYGKLYWANEAPIPEMRMLNRYNSVKDGAGTKGAVIGSLGTGAVIKIDTNERDIGWVRIMSVNNHDPVPVSWIGKLRDAGKPEIDWEWWVDETALDKLVAPGNDLVLQITVHPDLTYEVKKQ